MEQMSGAFAIRSGRISAAAFLCIHLFNAGRTGAISYNVYFFVFTVFSTHGE